MGRKSKPIEDPGPIGQLAQQLRDRRDEVVPKTTFRQMAAKANISHSMLADACAGKKLPTWETTRLFVMACGADSEEVEIWHRAWLDTYEAAVQLLRKVGEVDVVVRTHDRDGRPRRPGRLRPVRSDLVDASACIPRPDNVRTFSDLTYELSVLRIATGNPQVRRLSRHIDELYTQRRTRQPVPPATLSNLLNGVQRKPRVDLVMSVVQGLLTWPDARELVDEARSPADGGGLPWTAPASWQQAWSRAEFNEERPDLRRRPGTGRVFLESRDQDQGPAAGVIDGMEPAHAAALLHGLEPRISAGILQDLPPAKAQQLITLMWSLGPTHHVDQVLPAVTDGDAAPSRSAGPPIALVRDEASDRGGVA